MLKATRKARKLCKKKERTVHDARQMLSYLGWMDAADCYGMYRKRIKPFVSFRALKRKVGRYQERLNKEKELCGTKLKAA